MKNQNGKHEKKAGKPSRLGKWLALLPAGCALLYPLYLAVQLQTVEKAYINAALPRAFHGLKIAYVSDIHWGAFFSDERLQKLIEQVNALEADLIVLGGDYAEDADGALKFWQQKPAFKAGLATLAVFGNHDRTLPEIICPVFSVPCARAV
ncbi:MAG: metallophosphoesterase [Clostridia bacterium]|nr:metallophosphoesterase [Clostridia bacterium]